MAPARHTKRQPARRAEDHIVGPVRTCVGCRGRAEQAALLRVVGARLQGQGEAAWVLKPDLPRRAQGRGAYVHRDLACIDLALQRRAFGRALRTSTPPDATALRQWADQQSEQQDPPPEGG